MAAVESGLPKVQQEPSEALRIEADNKGAKNVPRDESRGSSAEYVVSIKEQLEQSREADVEISWAKLSIYRIPDYLKDGDKKAYVPQVVSLGPYHHGKDHLRHMDQHKWRCLRRILERSHHDIGLYLDSVKEVEKRARSYYDGTISMSSDNFVQMMVLDGCFVIELLQGVTEGFKKLGYPSNDPVFSMWGSMLKMQIQHDMILLENQIPLFILDRLLGLQLDNPGQEGRVHELVIRSFRPTARLTFVSGCGFHCLDVLWLSLLPPGVKRTGNIESSPPSDILRMRITGWSQKWRQLTPCVTKLLEEGIKLTRGYADDLLDIQFWREEGVLEIPSLEIHEGTRSLFLNLIAFEQSHFDCGNYITSYAIFMHNLMKSPEDVRCLCDRNIIKYCLGRESDAEVADLFKRLCQGVAFDRDDSYLEEVSYQMDACRFLKRISFRATLARKWNAGKAILKILYFDSPWSIIISIIAGCVLLVLTFIQAIYAVYGYRRVGS